MSRPLLNGRAFGRYTLSPRVRLVTEQVSSSLTSSVGVFVKCGSVNEEKPLRGVTHLAEHLFFKGSSKHSAEEISQIIERSGGDLNAYTDRELTCFHAWVPKTETFEALDLILEMLFDSVFDEMEFKKEKEVVLQELQSYAENPDDEFLDALLEVPWKKHPLGDRIAGFAEDVKKIDHSGIITHIKERFLKSALVISIVSPHAPEKVLKEVQRSLKMTEEYTWGQALRARLHRHTSPKALPSGESFSKRSVMRSAKGEQIQLAYIYPSVPLGHKDESLWTALFSLMGLGSSSYLFRELRENEGLVYSTYATYMPFAKGGVAYGYLATEKKNFFKAVFSAARVCSHLSRGIQKSDLDFVKSSMRGSLLMSFDGVNNRMENLGRQEVLLGRVIGLKESLNEIEEIEESSLKRIAEKLLNPPCFFGYGSVSAKELEKVKRVWKEGFKSP